MATFKYSFECCGVFPTLALKLPQLCASEDPKLFAEFSNDLSALDRTDDVDEVTQIVSPTDRQFGQFKKEILFDIDSFEDKGQLSPI